MVEVLGPAAMEMISVEISKDRWCLRQVRSLDAREPLRRATSSSSAR